MAPRLHVPQPAGDAGVDEGPVVAFATERRVRNTGCSCTGEEELCVPEPVFPQVVMNVVGASVPKLGGIRAPTVPTTTAVGGRVPQPEFFSSAMLLSPVSPFEFLYLKPFTALPLQNGFPVRELVPPSRATVCSATRRIGR
jgi:hypothetical protein